ncbi:MAG: bifunctional adenosylcobinamide kinase/adenosylcobinamide-phosphate guanylyltransferase [Sulfuricaulis sp.]
MKTLILGGIRSGKSRWAESLAQQSGLPVCYIATAKAGDDEMRRRIESHRAHRPAAWSVIEEPLALASVLQNNSASGRCVVVDCLTLWLTNLLTASNEAQFTHERDALVRSLPTLPGTIILVSNETGLGVIPLGELTRRFVDEAGHLHQTLAQACDCVVLTIASLPIYLKGESP